MRDMKYIKEKSVILSEGESMHFLSPSVILSLSKDQFCLPSQPTPTETSAKASLSEFRHPELVEGSVHPPLKVKQGDPTLLPTTTGLESFSPGLARQRLPWVNPEATMLNF